jgi:hypothetical protein
MLNRVASKLSHTFFMIWMTSRLCGVLRICQYGKSQNTDLLFHIPGVLVPFSSFLTQGTLPNRSTTSGFIFCASYVEVLGARLHRQTTFHAFSMGHSCWLATFDAPCRWFSNTREISYDVAMWYYPCTWCMHCVRGTPGMPYTSSRDSPAPS